MVEAAGLHPGVVTAFIMNDATIVFQPIEGTIDCSSCRGSISGKRGQLRPTAAMMAGMTDRLWAFEDLYEAVTN